MADNENISTTDYSIIVKHIDYTVQNVDFDDKLKEIFEEKGIPN